jgi:hypothetical protein
VALKNLAFRLEKVKNLAADTFSIITMAERMSACSQVKGIDNTEKEHVINNIP